MKQKKKSCCDGAVGEKGQKERDDKYIITARKIYKALSREQAVYTKACIWGDQVHIDRVQLWAPDAIKPKSTRAYLTLSREIELKKKKKKCLSSYYD